MVLYMSTGSIGCAFDFAKKRQDPAVRKGQYDNIASVVVRCDLLCGSESMPYCAVRVVVSQFCHVTLCQVPQFKHVCCESQPVTHIHAIVMPQTHYTKTEQLLKQLCTSSYMPGGFEASDP